MCNITHHYGIYTIEISTPRKFHGKHLIQTDNIDIEFSKVVAENIKTFNNKTHRERIHYLLMMYSL